MNYLLGIDVGTTGTKTILFSENGELIARDYRGYPLNTHGVGISEQRAEDWWQAVIETVKSVCTGRVEPNQVAAISLSLQGGTMVPVDVDYRPLRPAIVWNDTRCEMQMEEFRVQLGRDYMYNKTGWQLGRGLNALQIRWLRDNEPEIFGKTKLFLSVPDYISIKMTGKAVVDISDAGINQLTDIRSASLDRAILDFVGVREDQLAAVVPSGSVIGNLTREAAEELGLSERTVLVSGAHDQYAAAVGAGCVNSGDVLVGTGTAWVTVAMSDRPRFESGMAQSVSAVPGLWGSLISLPTAGVCMEWLRKNVMMQRDGTVLSFDDIDRAAVAKSPGLDGLNFFPYFNGTSFPKNEGGTKASLVGLDMSHDCFDIARAVMEGVAYHMAWILESFREEFAISSLKMAGGASKSTLWRQIFADVTNLPVSVPVVADLACVGAAIIAGTGCGLFKSAEEGYKRLAVDEVQILPNPDNAEKYAKYYEIYKNRARALGQMYSMGAR